MASYRDDEPQTLGDILPRMKPLLKPRQGVSENERAAACRYFKGPGDSSYSAKR